MIPLNVRHLQLSKHTEDPSDLFKKKQTKMFAGKRGFMTKKSSCTRWPWHLIMRESESYLGLTRKMTFA
jgi:hypothetical protein